MDVKVLCYYVLSHPCPVVFELYGQITDILVPYNDQPLWRPTDPPVLVDWPSDTEVGGASDPLPCPVRPVIPDLRGSVARRSQVLQLFESGYFQHFSSVSATATSLK